MATSQTKTKPRKCWENQWNVATDRTTFSAENRASATTQSYYRLENPVLWLLFFPVAYLVLKQVVSSNKSGRVIPCEAFHYKLPLFFVELHLVRRRFNFQEAKILGIHLKSALIISKIPYQVYQISHSYRNNSKLKFDITNLFFFSKIHKISLKCI